MKLRPAVLVLALSVLCACGGKPPPSDTDTSNASATPPAAAPEEKVVNIYNWSDYVAEDTIARFEKETGIKVVYDVYDANETLEAKLSAGSSGYDVVFPSARPTAQRHIAAGIYRELDKTKLPNWGNLDPAILTALGDVDPTGSHIAPYMWGTTGIGYNVAKVQERLGDKAPLDSWSLLFDPANAEKLKDCGISVLDDQQETFAAALLWLGRDPNASGADEIDVVKGTFDKIRPFVRYFNSSKYIDDLASGEICVAMGYSGDVLQARDRADEASNGIEIGYIIPKEGAVRWVDSMAIPSDAPHPNNAHAFINFMLRPDVIAPISDYVSYANANSKAYELVSESVRLDPGVYPPPDVMAKLFDPKTLPDDVNRARERAWTTIKSGQ